MKKICNGESAGRKPTITGQFTLLTTFKILDNTLVGTSAHFSEYK